MFAADATGLVACNAQGRVQPRAGQGGMTMRNAEQVTFGGSAFDRGGAMRSDAKAIARAQAEDATRAVVLWRGKPLITRANPAKLVRLAMDHPLLEGRADGAIFLGEESGFLGEEPGGARFAIDISDWQPDAADLNSVGAFTDPSEQWHPLLPEGQVFAELRRIMTWLSPRDAELAATAKAIIGWHGTHGFCAACGHKTVIAQAGWQRHCPACAAAHFPRTDPVVIMLITHGNSVLLGRSHGWPERMYSLLAGFVEPGETLEAAVRREVFEETAIQVEEVQYLASQPWPFPASLMVGCAGRAVNTEILVDPVEIEDALWASREEVLQALSGDHPRILPARKGSIAHFLLKRWLADTL